MTWRLVGQSIGVPVKGNPLPRGGGSVNPFAGPPCQAAAMPFAPFVPFKR